MKFMIQYQFGYMYIRYLLWNFAGRQSDVQGKNTTIQMEIGLQELILLMKFFMVHKRTCLRIQNNKGRNIYFAIPLLLALIGFVFHAIRDKKSFYVLLVLFLFTGFGF